LVATKIFTLHTTNKTQIESIAIRLLYGSKAGVENVLIPISHSMLFVMRFNQRCLPIELNTTYKAKTNQHLYHQLTTIASVFLNLLDSPTSASPKIYFGLYAS